MHRAHDCACARVVCVFVSTHEHTHRHTDEGGAHFKGPMGTHTHTHTHTDTDEGGAYLQGPKGYTHTHMHTHTCTHTQMKEGRTSKGPRGVRGRRCLLSPHHALASLAPCVCVCARARACVFDENEVFSWKTRDA